MEPRTAKSRRSKGVNTPGWVVLGIILSGGLFLFVWLALVGRRVLTGSSRLILWLLPIGAMLWIGGASLMFRGATAPTIPGETGNPLFLGGFLLTVLCLVLMVVFNNTFTRSLTADASARAIHGRTIGFTLAATGFLLSQLINEMTPVAPQNADILVLFQLICIMVGAVVGIQWVERVHAKHTEALVAVATSNVATANNAEKSAQRL